VLLTKTRERYGKDADDVGLDGIDEREPESPEHLPAKNSRSAQRRPGLRILEEELDARLNLGVEVAGHLRIHSLEPIESSARNSSAASG